jgi:hypothetical protein
VNRYLFVGVTLDLQGDRQTAQAKKKPVVRGRGTPDPDVLPGTSRVPVLFIWITEPI